MVASCDSQRSSLDSNDSPQTHGRETPAQTPVTSNSMLSSNLGPYDFTAVDRLLERAAPRLGGCALILIKGDKVIYRKAFGRYAVDKVVPVASASKWLSGALIMTLVDEGKLSLDDPVSKYLPEFSGDKAGITIRHLFAHTSGLPPETGCRNNKRTTLELCANEIARLRLRASPGEEFYYGGVSMHVGGRVAEIVSGKSWNDLFVEKIAAPLGMTRTDFLAYGPTANPRPAGDARSSIDDYGRFLQMILNGGNFNGKQLLSAASVAELHKNQTNDAPIRYTIYEKHGDLDPALPRARYGIGVWREKVGEGSGELLEASSQGALGFSPWIDMKRNLAGVLSVQSSMSRVMPIYLALKEEIRRAVPVSGNASGLP
ncbi:MAG: beta-lactamase family protein [Pyrinomonadaceae bacterium]|nr:beta-lactamase family protein [Pyrinomonadaceae bacterium]